MGNIEDFIKKAVDESREIEYLNLFYRRLKKEGIKLNYEDFIDRNLDNYNKYKSKYSNQESKYKALIGTVEEVRDYQAEKRLGGILGSGEA